MIFSTTFAEIGGRAGDRINGFAFCVKGVAKLFAPSRREPTEKRGVEEEVDVTDADALGRAWLS